MRLSADEVDMSSHDLAAFAAMLLSGIVGALAVGPASDAMKLAYKRVRVPERRRRR